jgi:hypothetical protein
MWEIVRGLYLGDCKDAHDRELLRTGLFTTDTMKIIYHVEHDGVMRVIQSPDHVDPAQPLAEQLTVKIGFTCHTPRHDTEDFEPRARLAVLELLNHLHNEIGIAR